MNASNQQPTTDASTLAALMTPAEIAPYFRSSDKGIRNDYHAGIIPAARVDGKRFLFDFEEVKAAYAADAEKKRINSKAV